MLSTSAIMKPIRVIQGVQGTVAILGADRPYRDLSVAFANINHLK